MTVEERINQAFDRIAQIGAKAEQIVLSEADLGEMQGRSEHRGAPIVKGDVGGHSFIRTSGAPSGDNTDFAI